jgi:hypothetical protein
MIISRLYQIFEKIDFSLLPSTYLTVLYMYRTVQYSAYNKHAFGLHTVVTVRIFFKKKKLKSDRYLLPYFYISRLPLLQL